jgi:hypothetical protein
VTTFSDSNVAGSGSLRAAILATNADPGTADDVITLSAGTYTLTLQHSGPRTNDGRDGALAITSTKHRLIIRGTTSGGVPATVIDAGGLSGLADRAFEIVNPGTTVVFQDLVIENGYAQDNGGLSLAAEPYSASDGGGILNNGGNLTLTDVVLQNNTAKGGDVATEFEGLYSVGGFAYGGGLYDSGGTLTLTSDTFTGNSALGVNVSTATISGSVYGGGFYASEATVTLTGNTFSHNAAIGGPGGSAVGGGFDVNAAVMNTLTGNTLSNNSATAGAYGSACGGGFYAGIGYSVSAETCALAGNSIFSNAAIGGQAQGGGFFVIGPIL